MKHVDDGYDDDADDADDDESGGDEYAIIISLSKQNTEKQLTYSRISSTERKTAATAYKI